MKKEVLIAIVIGFSLGLLITYGIWTANRAIKNNPATKTQTEQTTQVSPTPQEETATANKLLLTIDNPADNTLVDKNKIVVSGTTAPKATVVLLSEGNEKIMEADSNGKFSAEITLSTGSNDLDIYAYDKSTDNEATQKLTIVYSTAEI